MKIKLPSEGDRADASRQNRNVVSYKNNEYYDVGDVRINDSRFGAFLLQKLSLDYTEGHRRPCKLSTPMSYLADHTSRCRGRATHVLGLLNNVI